jgi:hypothetical protein
MHTSKVVETVEFEVPTSQGEGLLFRLEVLSQGRGTRCLYRCRLYRLENFRFQALINNPAGRGNEWESSDYRSWVVDDNLGIEVQAYPSIAKARNAALQILKTQLGLQ